MWGALLYGGRLVIVPYLVSRDPHAFYQLLCTHQVTVLNQTPSAFRQFLEVTVANQNPFALNQLMQIQHQKQPTHALRYVIFGGEALEFESLRPWFALHGDATPQLVNMYGITETTVHVTYQPIQATDLDLYRGSSRIGRAIPDLHLYILDAHASPVPVGVAGELHVGGAGLASGYLNRPALTAERFIEHPDFGRLYKTGDLCRWLPDGNLEYIGRTDFQVKIRGFRIELGEIESALLAPDGVREAVVLEREDHPGDQRLVAYVVGEVDRDTLRQHLAQHLPDYMVPSAFVMLETMPLTPNGKLDRRALPVPDMSALLSEDTLVPPNTPTEVALANMWSEVLGIEQVGIHNSFFDVGGHSLLATQLTSRIQKTFQVPLSLRHIFETPTIAALGGGLR